MATDSGFFSAENREIGTQAFLSALGSLGRGTKAGESGIRTREQEEALRRLLAELEAKGTAAFPGEIQAPLGELEGLSLEALEQQILSRVQGTGPTAEAGTALSRLIQTGGAPVDFEDFFQKQIRDPGLQEFREMILPELTRRFGSSGAFGSDRRLAEQQATERFGRTLTGARSELAFRSQSDAAERLLKAISAAPGVEGASVDQLLKLMEGAALPRRIEQGRLGGEFTRFQEQKTRETEREKQILAALGLTKGTTAKSGSSSDAIKSAAASAAVGVFLSDRRLKSEIVLIGELPSGLNLYRFRYKHDPRLLHFGVMADEVEQLMPEAIVMRDDGMKLVDYTMLSKAGAL